MTATLDTAATREDFITTMIERDGDPSTLKVFADWLEQRGECDLAYAYRWAASRDRWPRRIGAGWWLWVINDRRAELPIRVRIVVREVLHGTVPDSCCEAFFALSDALKQLRDEVAIADD